MKYERARNGREVALRVIGRVTTEDAWASRVLDAELSRSHLPADERGLATELSYGVLRSMPRLDALLAPRLKRGLAKTDELLVCALRLGLYQIVALDRIPPHAAVSETVSLVRALRSDTLSGVANAVLRGLLRENVALHDARKLALRAPVETLLRASLGDARFESWHSASDVSPPMTVRVREPLAVGRVSKEIAAEVPGATVSRGALSSAAVHLRRVGDARALSAWRLREIVVQDEGSQWIAEATGARPGESVADVCAGHGGKTLALLDAVGESGRVMAFDLYEEKLESLAKEAERLGTRSRLRTVAADLSVGVAGVAERFDRVLVDAPCTGLGTLVRRPEIGLRVQPSDPARLAELQLRILSRASSLVREGGTLVYAVCSPLAAEGIDVVRAFSSENRAFVAAEWPGAITSLVDEDGMVRLGPWSTSEAESPDLYQVFHWVRQAG